MVFILWGQVHAIRWVYNAIPWNITELRGAWHRGTGRLLIASLQVGDWKQSGVWWYWFWERVLAVCRILWWRVVRCLYYHIFSHTSHILRSIVESLNKGCDVYERHRYIAEVNYQQQVDSGPRLRGWPLCKCSLDVKIYGTYCISSAGQ